MGEANTPAAAADAAAVGGTEDTRPEPTEEALAEARKRGKVVIHPSEADVTDNPGARGYDQHGMPRPADARAVFLVVPKVPKVPAEPTPEDRGKAMRQARKAAEKARREKVEG